MSPARNPESSFTLDETSSAPAPGQASTAPVRRKTRNTVAVPLTESGLLDVDRIRDPQSIERARAALGVVDPASLPPKEPPKINKEFIKPAYSLLEVAIRFVGKKALKWPEELTAKMRFSEEKKEALVEPTAAVLARYAPAWLVDNQDIAALGACLADAVDDMINRAITEYVAEVRASQQPPVAQPEPAPTRFSTPVNSSGVAVGAAA